MFFILGISRGGKFLTYELMVQCPHCGKWEHCVIQMQYTCLDFFFIPPDQMGQRIPAAYELLPVHLSAGSGNRETDCQKGGTAYFGRTSAAAQSPVSFQTISTCPGIPSRRVLPGRRQGFAPAVAQPSPRISRSVPGVAKCCAGHKKSREERKSGIRCCRVTGGMAGYISFQPLMSFWKRPSDAYSAHQKAFCCRWRRFFFGGISDNKRGFTARKPVPEWRCCGLPPRV